MWKEKDIDLGTIPVKKKVKIEYQWEGEPLEVRNLRASCGCTVPVFDKDSGVLTATYIPGPIPKHLKYRGSYRSVKKLFIESTSGTHELSFSALVVS